MFEYDHSLLSTTLLHQRGIRGTKELEEVIEGSSFADEQYFKDIGYSIIVFTGFNNQSRALRIACTLDDHGRIVTLDARVASIEEIKEDFCKYCL